MRFCAGSGGPLAEMMSATRMMKRARVIERLMLAPPERFFDLSSADRPRGRAHPIAWARGGKRMTATMTLVTWLVSAAVALPVAQDQTAARPQRFDYLVRADFFAGAAGDDARLQKVIDTCERALEQNPQHAEAMVWHGAA